MKSLEFESAIVAVAAVAFAMDALGKELESNGFDPTAPRSRSDCEKLNRGDYVAQALADVFGFEQSLRENFANKLHQVFALRHSSVHFKSDWKDGVRPHPRGTSTAEELTVFTLEQARSALRIGREVLLSCLEAADKAGRPAKSIVPELKGVLAMFDDSAAIEGLELV